jgi:hypothetical protein
MLHKLRLALAVTILALAAGSAVDSASAMIVFDAGGRFTAPSAGFYLSDGTIFGAP